MKNWIIVLCLLVVSYQTWAQQVVGNAKCPVAEADEADELSKTKVVIEKLLPKMKIEKRIDFELDLEHLSKGGTQFMITAEELKQFVMDYSSIKKSDIFDFLKEQKKVVSGKTVYVIDIDPDDYTEELMNSAEFQNATSIEGTKITDVKGYSNRLKYIKDGLPVLGGKEVNIYETYSYDVKKGNGELTPKQIAKAAKLTKEQAQLVIDLNPGIKSKPEKIYYTRSVETDESGGSKSKDTANITKLYRIDGNKTLVVNTFYATLKDTKIPLFLICKAVKSYGTSESQNVCKLNREYFTKLKSSKKDSAQ